MGTWVRKTQWNNEVQVFTVHPKNTEDPNGEVWAESAHLVLLGPVYLCLLQYMEGFNWSNGLKFIKRWCLYPLTIVVYMSQPSWRAKLPKANLFSTISYYKVRETLEILLGADLWRSNENNWYCLLDEYIRMPGTLLEELEAVGK